MLARRYSLSWVFSPVCSRLSFCLISSNLLAVEILITTLFLSSVYLHMADMVWSLFKIKCPIIIYVAKMFQLYFKPIILKKIYITDIDHGKFGSDPESLLSHNAPCFASNGG